VCPVADQFLYWQISLLSAIGLLIPAPLLLGEHVKCHLPMNVDHVACRRCGYDSKMIRITKIDFSYLRFFFGGPYLCSLLLATPRPAGPGCAVKLLLYANKNPAIKTMS